MHFTTLSLYLIADSYIFLILKISQPCLAGYSKCLFLDFLIFFNNNLSFEIFGFELVFLLFFYFYNKCEKRIGGSNFWDKVNTCLLLLFVFCFISFEMKKKKRFMVCTFNWTLNY